MTRVLGVDPGSRATGWAIIETRGSSVELASHGVIRPKGENRSERLGDLHRAFLEVVEREQPDLAAVESPFSGVNARSALALAESRGVLLAVLGCQGVPSESLTPAAVKSSLVGTGQATKRQVAFMVVRILQLDREPAQDAADAMAVAIAHWRLVSWSKRLESQEKRFS